MNELSCIVESADKLGEGPCWAPREGRLYWFDIKGARLSWYEPEGGLSDSAELPMRASAAAPMASGGLLLATERGLAVFDSQTREVELRQPMDLGPGFRSNDGVMLGDGCFWWSSMDDDGGKRPGVIFRTCADGFTEPVISGIHIANSLALSPDGSRLYLADSVRKTIWTYDTADLARREVFAQTIGEAGVPDGSAMDAEGFLWNAQWGLSRVVRYAPDGRIDRVIEVPVEQPSCCAFGGPDLATLFITTAWEYLAESAATAPLRAGHLFAIEPGVKGLALPLFQA
ncbi:MAG: SMP-30/gluconolactonase/LRE family protein [Phenylobacterium sp.]|nr:MAG: SMP-30/gluconolactonase/LRE family protein [Phenylobacterium sp.]